MGVGQFYDAVRMKQIEDTTVVAGFVDINGHLLLERRDGVTIDAGDIRAPNLADATTAVKGIAQLATDAEAISGVNDAKVITPKALSAKIASIPSIPNATDTISGIVELATSAETISGADGTRVVTPAGLASLTSSATRRGLVELSTDAENRTGDDALRAVTPAGLTTLLRGGTQGRIPSSVTVGSGTSSVSEDGLITFSGCSYISLDGLFDGVGADIYQIEALVETSTAANALIARMRAGGVDNTTGNLHGRASTIAMGATAPGTAPYLTSNEWHFTGDTTARRDVFSMVLHAPGKPRFTSGYAQVYSSNGAVSVAMRMLEHASSAAQDGITFRPNASGTITGWLKIMKIG